MFSQRRNSTPGAGPLDPGNLLHIPTTGGGVARSGRRNTIFTIGEGLEFDEEDNDALQQRRKESIVYSSNSSLESESGETWGTRSRRRLSLPSAFMGLQSWVQAPADENGRRPSFTSLLNKKRKSYDEIKGMVNNGKYNDAKCSVRDGDWEFGHDIRTRLWPFLDTIHQSTFSMTDSANGKHQNGLTDYWENVKEVFGDTKSAKEIANVSSNPIGLPAPCPSSSGLYYQLDHTGKLICNRICSIICYTLPDITYCPLLCPIVALFLHYMEEEKAHNCACNLLSAKHKVFLTQTKVQWDVCAQTALALTKKFAKSTYATLVKNLSHNKLETIFNDWIWWIFRDLPVQHLVRIIDCFLMEGIKVLYRVTIGILVNFAKTRQDNIGDDLGAAISEHCKQLEIPPSRLLKSAFSIRNFRSAEIRRVATKVQFQIKGSGGDQNRGQSPFPRTKSGDSMPTSKSQLNVCSNSHTMNVPESESGTETGTRLQEFTSPLNVANFKTNICPRSNLITIWSWIPVRYTMYQPELIYTTEEHGSSLTTFFNRVELHEPTLTIIKTTSGEVFGAFCSTAWSVRNQKDQRGERQRYFGTGETFLFTLAPETKRYPWIGIKGKVEHAQELFMHADTNMLCIGGGEGTGIRIDSDLRFGKSERCKTFENDPLVGHHIRGSEENLNVENRSSGGDFEIQVLEVFGFHVV